MGKKVLVTSMSRNSSQSKSAAEAHPSSGGLRGRLHEVIFEADTQAGRAFDVTLIGLILLSVLAVMLESISSVREHYGATLYAAEWAFTILFTVEYVLRLASVLRPLRYATSFFGLVDLLAIIPT
jgi:voltage-gated potassium channel